ncbi:MAG TPA: alpha/beta hydrolase [Rhodanobacteraceae bacterium]|nr:alpha/beta hydrolase [Rhodanobacteraceae bacterium]
MIRALVLSAFAMVATGGTAIAGAADGPQQLCRTRSGEILQALHGGDYAAATMHFDATLATHLDAERLAQVWALLPAQFGAYKDAGTATVEAGDKVFLARTPMHFARGDLSLNVACSAGGDVVSLSVTPVQAAAAPVAANEHEIAVPSPLGPLPGLLTLPAGDGPFPAVLLVAGSGPNDRDETIGPNKPFRDLAQGLAAAGIASLRYDKRSHVYGGRIAANTQLTIDEEVTDDALTALRLLAREPHIDAHHLFVLGHSLGAIMAPRIGRRDPHVAGLVLMAAAPTLDLDIVIRQMRYLLPQQGLTPAQVDANVAPIIAMRDTIARADPAHPPAGNFFNAPASYWLSLRDYNAIKVSKGLSMPMLVLQGSGDFQVSPTADFGQWQAAFAHDPRVRLIEYPGLSHLFMPAGDPPSPADYARPAHVDAGVIHDIAQWIHDHDA